MKRQTIEKLLKKYLDGLTTEREERRLRRYFSQPNLLVPREWDPYRALFRYEVAQRPRPVRWPRVAIAAAVSLVLIGVGATLLRPPADYVLIDGQRITSQAVVRSEAEQAFDLIMASEESDFDALLQI